ncbi:hypothetical protein HKCCE2091_17090 [Rhodobacterales bacterium HKCCE2091]|nr:hypothetical protein [Rhodobacterales bacterium HKCCE2091]
MTDFLAAILDFYVSMFEPEVTLPERVAGRTVDDAPLCVLHSQPQSVRPGLSCLRPGPHTSYGASVSTEYVFLTQNYPSDRHPGGIPGRYQNLEPFSQASRIPYWARVDTDVEWGDCQETDECEAGGAARMERLMRSDEGREVYRFDLVEVAWFGGPGSEGLPSERQVLSGGVFDEEIMRAGEDAIAPPPLTSLSGRPTFGPYPAVLILGQDDAAIVWRDNHRVEWVLLPSQ